MISQIWNNYQENLSPVIRCLITGFLGGLLLFIVISCQKIFWAPFANNIDFFRGVQGIGSFILGLFIIGALSFRIVNQNSEKSLAVIFRGCLAGLTTGLIFLINLIIFAKYYPRTADTFFLLSSVLFEILSIPLILGGMGAYFYYLLDQQLKNSSSFVSKLLIWFSKRTLQIFIGFIIILIFTIGPPLLVYIGTWAGMI